MPYSVGAKVVHPAHGPGEIVAIAEKRFRDNLGEYYVVDLAAKRMQVMVPVDKADELGLRPISRKARLDKMWETLSSVPRILPNAFRERKAIIEEELSSGNLVTLARVVRDLWARRRTERRLSYTDRGFLDKAETQVAREVSVALDMDEEVALTMVREHVTPEEEDEGAASS
jgi:CarD family transcriptional regulator